MKEIRLKEQRKLIFYLSIIKNYNGNTTTGYVVTMEGNKFTDDEMIDLYNKLTEEKEQ